ncbi:MAG: hypothetical protein R3C03_24010 [Pirellulaceae bacterium]
MAENDQILATSALEKIRQGIAPTKSEARALEAVKEQKLSEMLRAVRAKFFNDLFGIQNNQRNQWEETLDIPCGRGRESIDLFAVCASIRTIFSKRMEIASGSQDSAQLKIEKLQAEIEKLQNQNVKQRTENELLARERLPKQMIVSRLDKMANIIRGVGEDLSRKSKLTGEQAQRMINHALDQYKRELSTIESL